jgi:hypothetical protein
MRSFDDCGEPVVAIFATAYVSLANWVLANWARQLKEWRWSRRAWSLGCLANLSHVLLAFHFLHNWDHSAAYAAIAQQTYEQVGWNWGGGLYINYGFCALWLLDAAYWWIAPVRYMRRSRWVDWLIQFTILFMFVNATVVFGKSPFRMLGGIFCVAGALGWILNSWHLTDTNNEAMDGRED